MTTAPASGDRVAIGRRIAYGIGAFVNNLLAAASGGMMIVLNLGYGMNPALVGLLGALPRLTDAATDPVVGHISDRTRSRWGRRRPYIFCGAIAAGLVFMVLWALPGGRSEDFYFWYFLAISLLFYLAYTVFATPWVALGYELTPDYHERTRLMGTQNAIGQTAYLLSPWFLLFMEFDRFGGLRVGAMWLAVVVGLAAMALGVVPALFLRERHRDTGTRPSAKRGKLWWDILGNVLEFGRAFGTTLSSVPFLRLCAATFLVFNGFILVAAFQTYVVIYYVFAGDRDAAGWLMGWFGTISAGSTFLAILVATVLGTRMGKRRAFFVCIGISAVGYALKWFCYSAEQPLLLLATAPLIAFGLGSLFTLMPSMVADICDLDEAKTGERREGMYGAIFWWVVKLGQAAAILAGGYLLNATGFDVALEGLQPERTLLLLRVFDVLAPLGASLAAIAVMWGYGLTEERMRGIRAQLQGEAAA